MIRTQKMMQVVSLGLVGGMMLAGCSQSSSQEEAPDEAPQVSQEQSMEEEQTVTYERDDLSEISSEHFGDIVWEQSIEADGADVVGVVGNRVVMMHSSDDDEGNGNLVAFDENGVKVWEYQISELAEGASGEKSSALLKNSVVVIPAKESEAGTYEVISLEDGSVSAEYDVADETTAGAHMRPGFLEIDYDVNAIDTRLNIATGHMLFDPTSDSSDEGYTSHYYDDVADEERVLLDYDKQGFHVLNGLESVEALMGDAARSRVPMLDYQVWYTNEDPSHKSVQVIDEETSEKVFDITCEPFNEGPQLVAHPSPNGEYAVIGNIALSADQGQCYGENTGQADVGPTLVGIDNQGRAFGTKPDDENSVVMVPFGASQDEVEDVGEQAPIGIVGDDEKNYAVFIANQEYGQTDVVALEIK